jgi:hypothetical protein
MIRFWSYCMHGAMRLAVGLAKCGAMIASVPFLANRKKTIEG